MPDKSLPTFTCFDGHHRVATGTIQLAAHTLKRLQIEAVPGPLLVFDDTTGRTIDIDTRGSDEQMLARLMPHVPASANKETDTSTVLDEAAPTEARGRGRPRLGVVAKEVTLLPRHWEWLGAQPGGASVALRKLVDEARRTGVEREHMRLAHERAYNFMAAIAGDFAGFEEASRALFANDRQKFDSITAGWPADVRHHAVSLGFGKPMR